VSKCFTCMTTHRVIFEYGAPFGDDLVGGTIGGE
jgi:hypothetical protein